MTTATPSIDSGEVKDALSFNMPMRYMERPPDWPEAITSWGLFWPVHLYTFRCVFLLMMLMTLVAMVITCRFHSGQKSSRPFYITLEILVLIVGLSRSFCLFTSYNYEKLIPTVANYLIMHVTSPSLASGFYLLYAALRKLMRMQVMSRLFHPGILICICLFNFAFTAAADIVVAHFTNSSLLMLLCQIYFIVWGVVAFAAYVYLFVKLHKGVFGTYKEMKHMQKASMHNKEKIQKQTEISSGSAQVGDENMAIDSTDANDISLDICEQQAPEKSSSGTLSLQEARKPVKVQRVQRHSTPLAMKLTMGAAILFLIMSLVNLSSLVAREIMVQQQHDLDIHVDPWTWLVIQTVLRLIELGLCILLVAPVFASSLKKKAQNSQ